MRNKYDTRFKYLAKHDLMPHNANINRSLIWKWKHVDFDKYVGFDLTLYAESQFELLKLLEEHQKTKKALMAYLRIINTFQIIFRQQQSFHTLSRNTKEMIAKTIIRTKDTIRVKKSLKLFHISRATLNRWLNNRKCLNSTVGLCTRMYPNQLSKKEVATMKQLMLDEKFRHWPMCSIAYYALREKIISVSVKTWYKYAKLLCIKRTLPESRRKKKAISIRASAPNQIWHADITVFKTLDNVTHYIYLLIDNYSRKILSWRIAETIDAHIRTETIQEALAHAGDIQQLDLIVDGGWENNNRIIDNFINEGKVNIRKLVALKDVPFSNSMIEASNKIVKYGYLYRHDYANKTALIPGMECLIPDFNARRPHCSLYGLTPDEVYYGMEIDKHRYMHQLKEARIERTYENKRYSCGVC